MRVALYLRVSTAEQTVENQEVVLRAVADKRGWTIVGVYRDEAISGAKGRDKRPGFDRLWKDAADASLILSRLGQLTDSAGLSRTWRRSWSICADTVSTSTWTSRRSIPRRQAAGRCCRWRASSPNGNAR